MLNNEVVNAFFNMIFVTGKNELVFIINATHAMKYDEIIANKQSIIKNDAIVVAMQHVIYNDLFIT